MPLRLPQISYSDRHLAREIIDFVAAELPLRSLRVVGDGGYATKEYLRDRPSSVEVVSRMLITGKLYEPPALLEETAAGPSSQERRAPGRAPDLGPQTAGLAATSGPKRARWSKRGRGCGMRCSRAACCKWSSSVAQPLAASASRGSGKPLPRIEAFFTTDLSLSLATILEQYRDRWAVEITLRDSYAFDGVGHDQCRKVERIVGANTLRGGPGGSPYVVVSGVRTAGGGGLSLTRYRPWYRRKCTPSQRDIVWTCREALAEAGVFPIPRFTPELVEKPAEPENALPLAA